MKSLLQCTKFDTMCVRKSFMYGFRTHVKKKICSVGITCLTQASEFLDFDLRTRCRELDQGKSLRSVSKE